eukprot:TRINITY_DN9097_c0_g1_i1.p1 TRINITY_DN9097_c0_g1~~TRINITY_DN9097_c0_g1_i1.p1  ORF type:complete len:254 (-),score=50.32 TRINITY_DN9097_c0_g1_i1:102-863(-)
MLETLRTYAGRLIRDRLSIPITEKILLRILRDTANGLQILHELGYAHMDLKPDNIYLRSNKEFVIGDFGLSRSKFIHGSNDVVTDGDKVYAAPEIMDDTLHAYEGYSLEKADVFSLGALMVELMLGINLESLRNKNELMNSDYQSLLRNITRYSTEIINLISNMLSPNHIIRPTASEIAEFASKLSQSQSTPNEPVGEICGPQACQEDESGTQKHWNPRLKRCFSSQRPLTKMGQATTRLSERSTSQPQLKNS